MAKEYDIEVYSQKSLYNPKERTLKIYFDEPDTGVNTQTGILMLISGYGGNANSNVYKKMRSIFADQYNFVTVQCDYFGYEYMQSDFPELSETILRQNLTNEEIQALVQDASQCNKMLQGKVLKIKADIQESTSNFNDMGPVQAMDHLIAMKVIDDILKQNGLVYNKNRIIAYGVSHGAYIAYMCNAFMPEVFTTIIDNSSYLYPLYIEGCYRTVTKTNGIFEQQVYYDYLIKHMVFDKEIYKLLNLYGQFDNQAHIIAFHGEQDHMTTVYDKLRFIDGVLNAECKIITDQDIDHQMFKNTGHGLGADFLKLFTYTMSHYEIEGKHIGMQFYDRVILTENYRYIIENETGVPLLRYEGQGGNNEC